MVDKLGSWYNDLKSITTTTYFNSLRLYLKNESLQYGIYPYKNDIFKAFILTPVDKVKVVIIGQDPYFNGSATGLAFANLKLPISPSLINIIKEIRTDIYDNKNVKIEPDLEHWAKNGVLLLNSALTVRRNDAGSHILAWKSFTARVLEILQNNPTIIYLLWGKYAESFIPYIKNKSNILIAGHPSPLNITNPFKGCKHFSTTNAMLVNMKKSAIKW